MKKVPTERIGANGFDEIKNHEWFEEVDWKRAYDLKIDPPIKPPVIDRYDLENFNKEVAKESIIIRTDDCRSSRYRIKSREQLQRKIQRFLIQ